MQVFSMEERDRFMREALLEARKAAGEDEVPVGAVIVRGGEIIARGHNRTVATGKASCHAELLCMEQAAELLKGRLTGCALFVTMEPCAMCAGAAVNHRLDSVFFGAYDDRAGCCGSVLDVTDGCAGYRVETWGGILETECARILTDFFRGKRA